MRILIIGAVAGGTGAATKARRNNEDAEIVIYEREKYISYSSCAMPYYLSGEITNDELLIPRDEEFFKKTYNIDVKTKHEVTKIDSKNKTITVTNLLTNEEFIDSFDKLVIATGARSFMPPITGIDHQHVFGLRKMADMYKIKKYLESTTVSRAVVIGAGFIGIEAAEAFTNLGIKTTLVERLPQVSPGLDKDMAEYVEDTLNRRGVNVLTNASAEKIDEKLVHLNGGIKLPADIVIVATGVTPNTEIAAAAGIELGEFKAIKVNEHLETNIKDIYAAGDCTEQYHLITNQAVYRPLGSTANKTARVVGDNLTGVKSTFKGVLGTSIYRVFNNTVAQTGLTEREAIETGYDVEVIHNIKYDKPMYLDGKKMIIKAVADRKTMRLLGVQIIGPVGVDKRIDVFATAITFKAKATDLIELDLAYAPPYATAKDPVHYTGMILENAIKKKRPMITPNELLKKKDEEEVLLIDARSEEAYSKNHMHQAINIPLGRMRLEIPNLKKDKTIVTYCGMGIQGNLIQNVLINSGFPNTLNLSGGYQHYTKTCLLDNEK